MDVNVFYQTLDDLFANKELNQVEPFLTASLAQAREESDYQAYIAICNEMIGYYRSVSEFEKSYQASEDVLLLMEELQMEETEHFLSIVQAMGVPIWVRHVVVPGLTDGEKHLAGLKRYVDTIKGVQKVELLPYHKLGVHKYEHLGIPYSLGDTPPMNPEVCREMQERIFGSVESLLRVKCGE